MKIAVIIIVGNCLNFKVIKFIDSGISEINEIESIIPAENAREKGIIVSLCFSFIKQGIIPIRVANPASVVIKKL